MMVGMLNGKLGIIILNVGVVTSELLKDIRCMKMGV
jgi:hypothetical protein